MLYHASDVNAVYILTSKCIATTTLAMRHYKQQGSTNYHKHIANTNPCFALALFQPEMRIWNPWKTAIVLKAQNIPKDVVACRFSFFCSISQVLGKSLNRCVVLLLLGPPVCVAGRSFGCLSTQYMPWCVSFSEVSVSEATAQAFKHLRGHPSPRLRTVCWVVYFATLFLICWYQALASQGFWFCPNVRE